MDIKALSGYLGHRDIKISYNIYIYILEDAKMGEIDKLPLIDLFLRENRQMRALLPYHSWREGNLTNRGPVAVGSGYRVMAVFYYF